MEFHSYIKLEKVRCGDEHYVIVERLAFSFFLFFFFVLEKRVCALRFTRGRTLIWIELDKEAVIGGQLQANIHILNRYIKYYFNIFLNKNYFKNNRY